MIVGEAPGAKEDLLGQPFVGRSGKCLDQLLQTVGLNPSKDVYICNAVKCRPPNNRRPTKKELKCSLPWLYQQIELVDPSIIVLAGSTAVQSVLGMNEAIGKLRGTWLTWKGRLLMPVFHPAYLLRNSSKEPDKPIALTTHDFIVVSNMLNKLNKERLTGMHSIHIGGMS